MALWRGLASTSLGAVKSSPRLPGSTLKSKAARVRAMASTSTITGKDVAVVGASRGIGLEFVRQLLDKGNRVLATARSASKAEELKALQAQHKDDLEVTEVDVSSADSIKQWAQHVRARRNHLDSVTTEDMLRLFQINTIGPLLVAQQLLKTGLLRKGAVIANMTSKMGSLTDNTSGGTYAYRASKAALNAVTKSMAIDLRDRGITVALLHPGWVKTDMTSWNGLISAEECVRGLITVLESGKPLAEHWYDYKHDEIPW